MDDDTLHADSAASLLNLAGNGSSEVTPLEQEVLDEYERLLRNMNQVRQASASPAICYDGILLADRTVSCRVRLRPFLAVQSR